LRSSLLAVRLSFLQPLQVNDSAPPPCLHQALRSLCLNRQLMQGSSARSALDAA
jgi:hypothetical protein